MLNTGLCHWLHIKLLLALFSDDATATVISPRGKVGEWHSVITKMIVRSIQNVLRKILVAK